MTTLFPDGAKVERAASVLGVEAAGTAETPFIDIVKALLEAAGMEAQGAPAQVQEAAFGSAPPVVVAEDANGSSTGPEINITGAPASPKPAPENPVFAVTNEYGPLNVIEESVGGRPQAAEAGTAQDVKAGQEGIAPAAVYTGAEPVRDDVTDIWPSDDELDRTLLLGELLPAGPHDIQEKAPAGTVGAASVPVVQEAYEVISGTAATEENESPENEILESDMAAARDDYHSHEVLAAVSDLRQAFLKPAVSFEKEASTLKEYSKKVTVETDISFESGAIGKNFITNNEMVFGETAKNTEGETMISHAYNTDESFGPALDGMSLNAANNLASSSNDTEGITLEPEVSVDEIPATKAIKAETPKTEPFNKEITGAFPEKDMKAVPGEKDVKKQVEPVAEKNADVADKEVRPAALKTEHGAEPKHGAHRDVNTVAAERKAVSLFNAAPKVETSPENTAPITTEAKTDHLAGSRISPNIQSLKAHDMAPAGEGFEPGPDGKAMEIDAAVIKNDGASGFDAEGNGYEAAQGFGDPVETESLNVAAPNAQDKFPLEAVKETKPAANQTPAPIVNKDVFERLGESIRLSVKENGGEVRITLKPESLGELRIKMNVENSAVRAEIVVDSHAVKAVLETDSTALRDAFNQQGLTLDKYTIEVSGANSSALNTEDRGSAHERHRENLREFNNGRDRDGASERQNPKRNPFEKCMNNERSVDFFA